MLHELHLREALHARSGRRYLDYIVNGRSLTEWLQGGDYIPPLGWLSPERDLHFRQMLMRKEPGDLPSGQVPLFVCVQCGQYDCGVMSVQIARQDRNIVWSSFGMETDEASSFRQSDGAGALTFTFDASAYYEAFSLRSSHR